MTPIDRMLAEHACTRLILEYARLNDLGDWDGLAELYTEDASFARPSAPDDLIWGREAIHASFTARPGRFTRHIVSNIVIDVDAPDTARANSIILLYLGEDKPESGVAGHLLDKPLIGAFADRLVLEKGVWRFSQRFGRLHLK